MTEYATLYKYIEINKFGISSSREFNVYYHMKLTQ